jgi:hypothetical protein
MQQEADRLLLKNYVPASVFIDTNLEILHLPEHTSLYLEIAPARSASTCSRLYSSMVLVCTATWSPGQNHCLSGYGERQHT